MLKLIYTYREDVYVYTSTERVTGGEERLERDDIKVVIKEGRGRGLMKVINSICV